MKPPETIAVPAALSWKEAPETHDYAAAANYLSLLMSSDHAERLSQSLRAASVQSFKAKDLLRASGSPLLAADDPHVSSDLAKVNSGRPLSPVLLIRGSLDHHPLLIADGYHRICAAYHVEPNADVPCHIIGVHE